MQELSAKLIPAGMSTWAFFDPEYLIPIQFIRRLACFLNLNPDECAAEWHQWAMDCKKTNHSTQSLWLLEDYCYAAHEAEQNSMQSLHRNRQGYRSGEKYPLIPNPHKRRRVSSLLEKNPLWKERPN